MKTKYQIEDLEKAKPCKSFFSKLRGLMFKKNSPPLLFIFNKEKTLTIHSFFCKPFTAIWLDKDKKATKIKKVQPWKCAISGRGMYLLEIPINSSRAFSFK